MKLGTLYSDTCTHYFTTVNPSASDNQPNAEIKPSSSLDCHTLTVLVAISDEGNQMLKVKTARLPQTLPLRSSSHFSAVSP